MSAWLHLRRCIALEFYEQALLGRTHRDLSPETLIVAYLEREREKMRTIYNPHNNFKRHVRLMKARKERYRSAMHCQWCLAVLPIGRGGRMAAFCDRACRGAFRRAAERSAVSDQERARRRLERDQKHSDAMKRYWAKRKAEQRT